jgi:hypothetical protein
VWVKWENACLVNVRPWVQAPVPQKRGREEGGREGMREDRKEGRKEGREREGGKRPQRDYSKAV